MSRQSKMRAFEIELTELINKHSLEGMSNTPDYLLSAYLVSCMLNFNTTTCFRDNWHGFETKLASNSE